MNILFVNYGDFTTNSLNHIGGFASRLCAAGHACVVAVPNGRDTVSVIPDPLFIPASQAELLARPACFPDGRPADIIHAWTPRETVRKFVVAYQRLLTQPARLIVHLEDNEEFLLERFTGKSLAELQAAGPLELVTLLVDGLPHPLRHQNLLRVADGVTVIVDSLKRFVPSAVPVQLLSPGVDFSLYRPQPADPARRHELGLREGERVLVFTGGTTFANQAELRDLYVAVALLNQQGTPTRLVRTGIATPGFDDSLGFDPRGFVLNLGFVGKAELPRLLALADVLVQPGRAGPFNDYRLPSKLPEFLASGRPVILPATNIAAAMTDGREALFLHEGTPEEIAGACRRVFADPALARRLGKEGAAFAHRHFDLAANTAGLEKLYAATLGRPPLADWTVLRAGGISEIALLPGVLHRQIETLPAGTPAAELAAQLESLAQQLAQLERASEAYDAPQAALAERLAEAEKRLALSEQQVRTLEKGLGLTRQHAENLEKNLGETRMHAASLEKNLADTRTHAGSLEDHLAKTRTHTDNLENHLSSTRARADGLEQRLGETRSHAENLQSNLNKTRVHADNLEDNLAKTRVHAENLEKILTDARDRLKEAEERCLHYDAQLALSSRQLETIDAELRMARERAGTLESDLTESRTHSGNLEKVLGDTRTHADNLEKMLADARDRLNRAEERGTHGEKLLSSARRQLESLDADLRLTRQHAGTMEKLNDTLQRRIAELDEHLASLIEIRRDREIKIRQMQDSFSWQVTKPLRWFRRGLVDPLRKTSHGVTTSMPNRVPAAGPGMTPATKAVPPAETAPTGKDADVPASPPAALPAAPAEVVSAGPAVGVSPLGVSLWYSVDHPRGWSLPPRKTMLRGWCFADDGRKLAGIRAVLPDRTVTGTHGFKRLDVLAAMRGKTQAEYSGWKIEIELTAADERLALEAADESGAWHRFFHATLRVGEGFGPPDLTSYEKWVETYDTPTPEALRAQAAQAATLARQPLISVVMPVYNTPERWLRRAIESVRAQTYPHWELCIADDASPEPHVRPLLQDYALADPRIKVAFREKNGHISASSNTALALATGEFVALLDHDDELAPEALFAVATALNERPEADYLYSDEDKIDEEGRRFEPYFKPDFLPDLFHGQNYTSHLSVYRTSLVRQVGGFRVGYEGSQDWDLALRVIEKSSPGRIVHVPRVLYHWRAIPGSTALLMSEKNYPVEAARRALGDHFARLGQPVELIPVPGDHWRVKYPVPSPAPLVSLVIPTRNGLPLIRRCVEGLLARTTYSRFEIIIVDNQSDDAATLAWLGGIADPRVRVLPYAHPFNYSAINNFAVREARGEFVGLLNNDLEVIHDDWLEEMVSQAARPGIGCVGAMLYYPNDAIQHAGAVLGVGGVAGHAFRDFPRGTEGKFNRGRLVQNYSAVTAACLVVRKDIYAEVGGLDENDLAVAFNDIDFCLKVRAAGYRNLWTPFAELYHHESASRGSDDTPEKEDRFRREVETMLLRWGTALTRDPAYNPNLTLESNDFTLASPPRPAIPG